MQKITNPARIRDVLDSLKCSLCNKVFKDATTINTCVHTFCSMCIYKKLQEDDTKSCPVCHEKLGPDPTEYLRPDESLRNIVKKITFGYKKKESEEGEGSKASNSEVENVVEILSSIGGNSSPTSSLESTTNFPAATNPTLKGSKETLQEIFIPMDVVEHGQPKEGRRKKRNTTRKARQFNAPLPTKNTGKEKAGSASGTDHHGALPAAENKMPPLWFLLFPAEDKNGNGFPKLDKSMIRLKDYSATVFIFQKYLKEKLNLENEDEIELTCVGEKLEPTMNLHDIKKLWIKAVAPGDGKKIRDQWKLKELRIELAYSKRNV